mgnify:CR=1 FL=1
MTALKDIRVETADYEFAHGHKPRGSGLWAFYIGKNQYATMFHSCTYTDAVYSAKRVARDAGWSFIVVGA